MNPLAALRNAPFARARPRPPWHLQIQSLTIRGKRGNIVQSYPGVEHDFEPSPLVVEPSRVLF